MKTGRLLFVILNCITLSTIYITSWTNCNINLLDELSIDDAPQTLQSDRFHVIDSGDSNRDDDDGYNVNEFELAESRGEVLRKRYHGKKGKIAWLMRYVCDLWLAFGSVSFDAGFTVNSISHSRHLPNKKHCLVASLILAQPTHYC
jgi:hypothetical protein